jgi:cell division protein FtsQ
VKRRGLEGSGMLPGMEELSPRSPGSRSSRPELSRATRTQGRIWSPRLIASTVAGTLFIGLAIYAFHLTERFLIGDPRFALNGADGETPSLAISGAVHSSERAIEGVFAGDIGHSVYTLPLAERRVSLQAIDWVKDASVARIWPNTIQVLVVERVPVAFVALKGRYGLIDDEGVLLSASKDRFHLPVLAGVQPAQPIAERRERVHRMLRVLAEVGDESGKLSEIDVTDRDNIKVSLVEFGQPVWLMLGDRHFGLRFRNFLAHFNEIRKKLPGADTFDLRLEDRITAVD